MSAIEFRPERGEILVGTVAIAGRPVAGGSIEIGGNIVRPLTLAERDRVVHLAAASDEAIRRCALLVAEMAIMSRTFPADESGAAVADDSDTIAAQAVALQLAGASMPGPLAQSALLVARAVGASAGEMAAIDADRLAAELAPVTTEAMTADAGWTTITYAEDHTGADVGDDGGPAAGGLGGLIAVRDDLAAALVQRARERLDPDLADRLLRGGDTEHTAAPDPADRLPAHADAVPPGPAAANPPPTGRSDIGSDRWAPSPAPGLATTAPDPAASGRAPAASTERVGARHAPDPVAPPPRTHQPDPVAAPPRTHQPDRRRSTAWWTSRPTTLPSLDPLDAGSGPGPVALAVPTGAQAAAMSVSAGRWGRLRDGDRAPVGIGAAPRTDRWSPAGAWSSEPGGQSTTTPTSAARPARRVPDHVDHPTGRGGLAGGADQSVGALAHALHRAADVRGVPR